MDTVKALRRKKDKKKDKRQRNGWLKPTKDGADRKVRASVVVSVVQSFSRSVISAVSQLGVSDRRRRVYRIVKHRTSKS